MPNRFVPQFSRMSPPQVSPLFGQQQQGPSGIAALLANPAIRQALLATGSGLMAQADQPGNLAGALGRALPGGIQAFRQGQRRQQFDDLIGELPQGPQRILQMLGPDGGGLQMLAQRAFAEPSAPKFHEVDGNLVRTYDDGTAEAVFTSEDDAPAVSAEMRDAAFELGVDLSNATPDERARVGVLAQRKAVEREQAGVQPLPDVMQAQGAQQLVGGLVEGRDRAQRASEALERAREASRILNQGAPFTGTGAEARTRVDRVLQTFGFSSGDRAADTEQLMQLFRTNALDVIQNFPGQLSEKELEAAQFLAGDVGLTPQTIQSVIDAARTTAEAQIRLHNSQVENLFPQDEMMRRGFLVGQPPVTGSGGTEDDSVLARFGITPVRR